MKDRVVSYKWYAVWEYEKEEEDLNEASKKGLQLRSEERRVGKEC